MTCLDCYPLALLHFCRNSSVLSELTILIVLIKFVFLNTEVQWADDFQVLEHTCLLWIKRPVLLLHFATVDWQIQRWFCCSPLLRQYIIWAVLKIFRCTRECFSHIFCWIVLVFWSRFSHVVQLMQFMLLSWKTARRLFRFLATFELLLTECIL